MIHEDLRDFCQKHPHQTFLQYVDDLLIVADSKEEFSVSTRKWLETLGRPGFCLKRVTYLGYILEQGQRWSSDPRRDSCSNLSKGSQGIPGNGRILLPMDSPDFIQKVVEELLRHLHCFAHLGTRKTEDLLRQSHLKVFDLSYETRLITNVWPAGLPIQTISPKPLLWTLGTQVWSSLGNGLHWGETWQTQITGTYLCLLTLFQDVWKPTLPKKRLPRLWPKSY